MQQLAGNFLDLGNRFYHMHRNPDGSCLVGNGTGNCLPNPPGCIGGKLKALRVVELLYGLDQAEVALLNQVEELHAAAEVTLRDADDEAQVRL